MKLDYILEEHSGFRVRVGKVNKNFSYKRYGVDAMRTAIAYRDKLIAERNEYSYLLNTNPTLEELYMESLELYPIRAETMRKHLSDLRKHIGLPNRRIKTITRADIVQSLAKNTTICSYGVLVRMMTVWHRLYKTALVKDYVVKDLTIGLVVPKSQVVGKEKRAVLTTRETMDELTFKVKTRFLDKYEGQAVSTALEVMWYTGLRPAECFALSVDDIKNGEISITKSLGSEMATPDIPSSREYQIVPCKTDRAIRKIPIPKSLQIVLDNYESVSETGKLFPNHYDQYFNLSRLQARLRKLVPNFNMYQLRHTLATKLIVNNVDKRTITEILGHENINMSIYYARSNNDLKREALE